MKKKTVAAYHDDLIKRLKDARYAEAYLNAALEDRRSARFLTSPA